MEVYQDGAGWVTVGAGEVLALEGQIKHALRNTDKCICMTATGRELIRFFQEASVPLDQAIGAIPAQFERLAKASAEGWMWLASPEENAAIGIELRRDGYGLETVALPKLRELAMTTKPKQRTHRLLACALLLTAEFLSGCGTNTPIAGPPPGTEPAPNGLYVSAANGSDLNPGTAASPFATIGKCLSSISSGQACIIASGVYPEMLVPPIDNVSIVAAPGAQVIVTAADAVTGWVTQGNGIYSASATVNTSVPMQDGRSQFFPGMQLFYNEVGVPQAQWPAPSSNPLQPNWATIASATPETQVQAAPGGSITYNNETVFDTTSNKAMPGGYYYLVGGPELLTANTWAYDPAKKTLYWQAPAGIDPNHVDVRFKQRYATIDLSGRSNITVRGLQLVGAGVLMNPSSASNVLDGITATYLSSAQQSHSNGPSDHDDYYSFGILLDGTGNTLKNSVVAYSALNGVTIHGTGNTVSNSLIHDVDWFGEHGAGISIGDGVNNVVNPVVTHNTIYNVGYAAILFVINPDVQAGAAATNILGADINNNQLFRSMFLATDGGAIYACCASQMTGTEIHDNWIHGDITPRTIAFGAAFPEIFLHGALNGPTPTPTLNVTISNNTTPDATSGCNLSISALALADNVTALNNQVYFQPYLKNETGTMLTLQNNMPSASGVTDGFIPGCNFSGCAIGGQPPLFSKERQRQELRRPVRNPVSLSFTGPRYLLYDRLPTSTLLQRK
ncbi:hypothetical protein U1Q18_052250 [Sarracenia purpurea var. burkii]